MLISLRWLKQYLNFEIAVEDIVETLTFGGIEVEQAHDLGMLSGKIVVGRLLAIEPHPAADKLSLCQVDIGKDETLSIVCGASNMKVGDHVPVALEGAQLPSGRRIERAVLKGVESHGMLCSGIEVSYGDDAGGLLLLPEEWAPGEPFDYLIDVKITPNRPDCLSIFGVARDLAALKGKKIYPPQKRVPETMERIETDARISTKDKAACPRYTARILRNITVGPSPRWLARAVESVGLRSINNIVDVTNYVMMELGHPLHAFDLDDLANHEIIVRLANEGETIQTLDGVTRELIPDDLLITTPNGPVALAGVMGGQNSEISEKTTNILLESAYFDPVVVRKTAKRLDMHTDASHRFERGMDLEKITLPLNRATQLLREINDAEVVRGILDISATIAGRSPITLEIARANQRLGLELTNSEMADILVLLGCEIERSDQEQLLVLAPSYRVDIEGEHDLIEEIARLYGYNKIEPTMPLMFAKSYAEKKSVQVTDRLRDALCERGGHEAINYSFIAKEDIERFGLPLDNTIELLNPLSQDQTTMRPSLIPGLLNCLNHNHNHNLLDFQMFEFGKVFHQAKEEEAEPSEELKLLVAISGNKPKLWSAKQETNDFYAIKGLAEDLLKTLGIAPEGARLSAVEHLHPGQQAEFVIGGQTLCRFGKLHPRLGKTWELRREIWLLEASINDLIPHANNQIVYQDIGRFPAIMRDFSFIVKKETPAGEIEAVMREEAGELLEQLHLFDLFRGKGIPTSKKSLAFSITLRDKTRTLTDEEANKIQDAIISRLQNEFQAKLRES